MAHGVDLTRKMLKYDVSGITILLNIIGRGYIMVNSNRSLAKFILFTILTCGIYALVFLYGLVRDVNVLCDGDGKKTAGLIKLYLLGIITCGIYIFVWYYSLGNRLAENAPRYGLHFTENGTSVLLWQLFGTALCGIGPFVAMNILIKNTNALANAYNAQVANGVN